MVNYNLNVDALLNRTCVTPNKVCTFVMFTNFIRLTSLYVSILVRRFNPMTDLKTQKYNESEMLYSGSQCKY